MSDSAENDLLAAEYVLGCLSAEEASAAERLLAEDADFANAVEAWQRRMTPLAALADPVAPPDPL